MNRFEHYNLNVFSDFARRNCAWRCSCLQPWQGLWRCCESACDNPLMQDMGHVLHQRSHMARHRSQRRGELNLSWKFWWPGISCLLDRTSLLPRPVSVQSRPWPGCPVARACSWSPVRTLSFHQLRVHGGYGQGCRSLNSCGSIKLQQ